MRPTGVAQPAKIVCRFQSRLSDFWREIEWLLHLGASTRNGHDPEFANGGCMVA
jgi:hypothetical protein